MLEPREVPSRALAFVTHRCPFQTMIGQLIRWALHPYQEEIGEIETSFFDISIIREPDETRELLAESPAAIVIANDPEDEDGLKETFRYLRSLFPATFIVCMSWEENPRLPKEWTNYKVYNDRFRRDLAGDLAELPSAFASFIDTLISALRQEQFH